MHMIRFCKQNGMNMNSFSPHLIIRHLNLSETLPKIRIYIINDVKTFNWNQRITMIITPIEAPISKQVYANQGKSIAAFFWK